MPFCDWVDWFLTNTRLADVVTPSIVCSPDNVMLAVVATNTAAFVFKPWATESTYCLVANCRAWVGSCVTATDVKPPNVRLVAPREILVVPMVKELFVNAALAMLLNVPPKVKLPELVTVPVKVKPLTLPAPETEVTVPPPDALTCCNTNAVVANCVVFVFKAAVGAVGVPVNAGLTLKTLLPEPVLDVTPVPPLATGKTPVTPDVKGKPVTLVIVPEEGVPNAGVTNVGLFCSTTTPEPVVDVLEAAVARP